MPKKKTLLGGPRKLIETIEDKKLWTWFAREQFKRDKYHFMLDHMC